MKPDLPAELQVAIKRRIVIGQSLYAFGTLLCAFLSTYWSIGFIVLVQLYYANRAAHSGTPGDVIQRYFWSAKVEL